jgi:hypothetical protein
MVLLLTVTVAVIVVLVAGMTGAARFSGPRWVPRATSHHHAVSPKVAVKPVSKLPTRIVHASSGSHFGIVFLIIAVIVVALALLRLWLWWRNRPTREEATLRVATEAAPEVVAVAQDPEPDPPVLLSGIELALQTLDEHRDPADAIVRAWLGLQETAEQSGIVRRASETPTEFTSRILRRAFADDRAIGTLLRLYLRTRFGDHPPTAADVADVRAALSDLVAGWHSGEAIIRR